MKQIQIEIFLPLTDNNKIPFDEALFLETQDEILERFGGITVQETPYQGAWMHGGTLYADTLRCIFVVTDDTEKTRQFLRDAKERLKVRFDQIDLLILVKQVEWI